MKPISICKLAGLAGLQFCSLGEMETAWCVAEERRRGFPGEGTCRRSKSDGNLAVHLFDEPGYHSTSRA